MFVYGMRMFQSQIDAENVKIVPNDYLGHISVLTMKTKVLQISGIRSVYERFMFRLSKTSISTIHHIFWKLNREGMGVGVGVVAVCVGGRGYILFVSIDCRMDYGFMKSILYVSCYVKGIFTVSPEPSLFVHMKYGSKRRVRQKI